MSVENQWAAAYPAFSAGVMFNVAIMPSLRVFSSSPRDEEELQIECGACPLLVSVCCGQLMPLR